MKTWRDARPFSVVERMALLVGGVVGCAQSASPCRRATRSLDSGWIVTPLTGVPLAALGALAAMLVAHWGTPAGCCHRCGIGMAIGCVALRFALDS